MITDPSEGENNRIEVSSEDRNEPETASAAPLNPVR